MAGIEPAQPCSRGKDPRNHMILIGLGSCPIRALEGRSTLVFNGVRNIQAPCESRGVSGSQKVEAQARPRPVRLKGLSPI